jgi:hypothetical protein
MHSEAHARATLPLVVRRVVAAAAMIREPFGVFGIEPNSDAAELSFSLFVGWLGHRSELTARCAAPAARPPAG